ncbi:C-C Motif Chemokine 3-Like 1 [Manis pentadactyla]|nr:C-C Motif Chemokine 3-Like 1 [Manis pentadactyla]
MGTNWQEKVDNKLTLCMEQRATVQKTKTFPSSSDARLPVRRRQGLGLEGSVDPVAALAVLLLTVTFCSQTSPALFGANTPTACCFFYASQKIPQKFVSNYYETSSQCSKSGIIFQTKRGRQVCADPSEVWVWEYITNLELNV